jgi:hypothetical protein
MPEDSLSDVRRMSLTADGQGAVFDVPIALAKDFVAGKGIDLGLFFFHASLPCGSEAMGVFVVDGPPFLLQRHSQRLESPLLFVPLWPSCLGKVPDTCSSEPSCNVGLTSCRNCTAAPANRPVLRGSLSKPRVLSQHRVYGLACHQR